MDFRSWFAYSRPASSAGTADGLTDKPGNYDRRCQDAREDYPEQRDLRLSPQEDRRGADTHNEQNAVPLG